MYETQKLFCFRLFLYVCLYIAFDSCACSFCCFVAAVSFVCLLLYKSSNGNWIVCNPLSRQGVMRPGDRSSSFDVEIRRKVSFIFVNESIYWRDYFCEDNVALLTLFWLHVTAPHKMLASATRFAPVACGCFSPLSGLASIAPLHISQSLRQPHLSKGIQINLTITSLKLHLSFNYL